MRPRKINPLLRRISRSACSSASSIISLFPVFISHPPTTFTTSSSSHGSSFSHQRFTSIHRHPPPSPLPTASAQSVITSIASIYSTLFYETSTMPPKRIQVQPARRGQQAPEGYLSSVYNALMDEDNRSVVISIAMFGVSL